MPSRNQLINGPVGEREVVFKPFARFMYHKRTGTPKLFTDRKECEEATCSGLWTDSPAKVANTEIQVDELNKKIATNNEEEQKRKAALSDLTSKFDNPKIITPEMVKEKKKNVGIMNSSELRMLGFKYGFDWVGKTITRKEMITAIRQARKKERAKR